MLFQGNHDLSSSYVLLYFNTLSALLIKVEGTIINTSKESS